MREVVKPIAIMVLDGFGVSPRERGNAVLAAETPALDAAERRYPMTLLQASGLAVGLPWGEAGNSEVGHLTMGAGRAIHHHLPRIIVAIRDGSFFQNPAFAEAAAHVRARGSSLHLIGLVSSGSVHSYADHLWALLELARRQGVGSVWLHAITDGKDAPPREGQHFIADVAARIRRDYPNAALASLVGRSYAMDRDEQWDRIRMAYELLTQARGEAFGDPAAYLEAAYRDGQDDASIPPGYRAEGGAAVGRLRPGDAVIFFNFREDAMRELTAALAKEPFDAFPRERLADLRVVTMTEYDRALAGVRSAFPPLEVSWPLARVIAEAGRRQLHIAETEKYAHVTYFFNGGREAPFPGEDRILVPSFGAPHFDERPEMRAPDITAKILERWGEYDFILGNLANADMVGHTGNFPAAVKAVEALDQAVSRLMAKTLEEGGALIVTGDHGNAEEKLHPISGEPVTEHTLNPVPCYLIGRDFALPRERSAGEIAARRKEVGGILSDIAPTVLELMDLEQPAEMTGESLLPKLLNQI